MSHISDDATGGSGGIGDVVGPASSTDNAIVRFDGISGKLIKNSATILIEGSGQTVGAVTSDLITISMGAVPSTYSLVANVSAFEASTPAGAQYVIIGAARTTGASANLVGIPDPTINEEAALSSADCDIVVSGNNVIVRATGVSLLTINWSVSVTLLIRS